MPAAGSARPAATSSIRLRSTSGPNTVATMPTTAPARARSSVRRCRRMSGRIRRIQPPAPAGAMYSRLKFVSARRQSWAQVTGPHRPLRPWRRSGPSENGDGLGVVAGGRVAGAVVDERRGLVDAALALGVGQVVGELGAAGPEAAAAGRVERARD